MGDKKKYWKGLDEYNQVEEFEKGKHNEFAEELPIDRVFKPEELNLSANRRDFLKFFGFSTAAATLAACSKTPVKKAIPYLDKPAEIEPGIPNYYASTCHGCSANCAVVVKTREGRPIKIEPNREAGLLGGTCALGQATVLSLYDRGRLTGPAKGNQAIDWAQLDKEVKAELQRISGQGKSIVILSETILSPSTKKLIGEFSEKFTGTKHITFDPVSAYGLLQAHKESFGKFVVPGYSFDKSKVIVSVNADFLGTWISPVEYTRQYSDARRVDEIKSMAYHIQFETNLSLSGANADRRIPIKASQEAAVLLALLKKIGGGAGYADPNIELAGNSIQVAADELRKNRGEGIVLSGSNDPEVQKLVIEINQQLGNYGKTISMDNPSYQKQGNDVEVARLMQDMEAGNVGAVLFYGANPVYNHPQGEKFKAALGKVGLTISFSDRPDETAKLCTYIAPDHHYLEKWNDSMPRKGRYHVTQPTITPLFDTRAAQDSLLNWAENDVIIYHDYIKKYWEENLFAQSGEGDFDDFWIDTLHNGYYLANGTGQEMPEGAAAAADTEAGDTAPAPEGNSRTSADRFAKEWRDNHDKPELLLYQKVGIREGDNSNNPWLHELPDPISKICWDNYVCVSAKYAKEQGWKEGDHVKVTANGYSLELPVYIQPGQAYRTFSIAVGYGHDYAPESGRIANTIGKNAYPLASVKNGAVSFYVNDFTIEGAAGNTPLAQTQTHHHMESRDLIREASATDYLQNPKSVYREQAHLVTLYREFKYPGHHWGMAIDLTACTGCGSCVVACQAENNIPVVGKEEVLMRREMHWIRIDRYFAFQEDEGVDAIDTEVIDQEKEINKIEDPSKYDNVKVAFQPMLCQHCDNAPCENVCPVAAIAHSSEGLNMQVYNRCVGTRYCANNCPYKVRRFNWFSYYSNEKFDTVSTMSDSLSRMVLNPDVVVRARGVMEKCSFCAQRIQLAKLEAKKDRKPLEDGAFTTACAQACPANAIIFGDMNDPESEVFKRLGNHRTYGILTEIQTKPSVNYMTKIRASHTAKA